MVPSPITGSDRSGGEPRSVVTSTGGAVTPRSGGLSVWCCPRGRLPAPANHSAASPWRTSALTDHRGPHARLRVLALGAALAAALLAACGQPAAHNKPPTSTPSATASASPTADPTTASILNAYEQSWAAWHSAAAIPEINYAGITQWFTGQALVRAQGLLTLMVQLGQVETGTRELHPVVESISGTTAIVQDCLYSTAVIVYKSSGVPVTPQPGGTQPEWDSETATLGFASGSWHVSSGQEEFGSSCRPASPSP